LYNVQKGENMKKNSFGLRKGYKGVTQKTISKKKVKASKIKAEYKTRANLKTLLQSIYRDHVNLETTCNHNLCCCETAMPMLSSSEFTQVITDLWKTLDAEGKINTICKSIEYFFKYDYQKWGKDTLVKPCMFLNKGKKICEIYENRPLNCRLYGLWPHDAYTKRVDRFESVYSQYGLKREDLPLNTQCPYVKRKDVSKPITEEVIDELFNKLNEIDKKADGFTNLQIEQKENYRTFHDWLLLKIYGEEWLAKLTAFIMAADKNTMQDQIEQIIKALKENFLKNGIPDVIREF
jgi:Fe-S-cluster containining protein